MKLTLSNNVLGVGPSVKTRSPNHFLPECRTLNKVSPLQPWDTRPVVRPVLRGVWGLFWRSRFNISMLLFWLSGPSHYVWALTMKQTGVQIRLRSKVTLKS